MKSIQAYLCFSMLCILLLPGVSAQIRLKHARGNISVRYHPYFYKVYSPNTYESGLTEMKFDALAGFSGEKYLGEHLGIRFDILGTRIRWETGVRRTHSLGNYGYYYTKYVSYVIQPESALRLYHQAMNSPFRAFLELGGGLTFEVSGSQSRPSHPDSEIARLVIKRPFQKWYYSLLASAGIQYRWSNHWGFEAAAGGRLPLIMTFIEDEFPVGGAGWKNFQYGLNLACNYFLPEKKMKAQILSWALLIFFTFHLQAQTKLENVKAGFGILARPLLGSHPLQCL